MNNDQGYWSRQRAYQDTIDESTLSEALRGTLHAIVRKVRWNQDQQEYYESNRSLAARLGLTGKNANQTVNDRMQELVAEGWLDVLEKSRGKTTRYALRVPDLRGQTLNPKAQATDDLRASALRGEGVDPKGFRASTPTSSRGSKRMNMREPMPGHNSNTENGIEGMDLNGTLLAAEGTEGAAGDAAGVAANDQAQAEQAEMRALFSAHILRLVGNDRTPTAKRLWMDAFKRVVEKEGIAGLKERLEQRAWITAADFIRGAEAVLADSTW